MKRTFSIPGTGLSYTQETKRNNSCRSNHTSQQSFNMPYETTREIESGNVAQFQTAEANSIVASIHRTISLNSWGTILICCILFAAYKPAFILLPIAGIIMKILARTVAVVDLEYSFDAEAEEEQNRRIDAWTILAEGDKEWQITSEQFTSNIKAHAGANRSINRIPCTIKKGRPFYIKTNVDTVEIKLKKETLIILPDKVFVIRGKKVGLVDYKDLNISVSSSNFRENEKVPEDARVVGTTWQFVNANGTLKLCVILCWRGLRWYFDYTAKRRNIGIICVKKHCTDWLFTLLQSANYRNSKEKSNMAVTDKEIMQRAKQYIDKLANGINPLTDEPLRDEDIVNNVRISRCLFYVSGILDKVIQNPRMTERNNRKRAFSISQEQLEKYEYSQNPMLISEIARRISSLTDDDNTRSLPASRITGWLVANGFLEERVEPTGKTKKYVTSAGNDLGIFQEERNSSRGPYLATLYTIEAQHFIIDNIEAILAD